MSLLPFRPLRRARLPWPPAGGHRALRVAIACALATLGALGSAAAQGVDCDRLYAALQGADDTLQSGGQWTRAAQRQRDEIDRTQRYADQLNCGSGGFFDDADGGPQCSAITDRLRRMHDNLDTIEAQASREADSGARRAQLLARYNASCVAVGGGNPEDLAQRNGRGFLPEGGESPDDLRTGGLLPDGGLSAAPPDGIDGSGASADARDLGQAICVRSCDGGWFPLASSAPSDQVDHLAQICQAQCPAAETKLYTMTRGDDLASAVTPSGASYTALPAAFGFQKKVTPSCACKAPGQSWAEVLAGAETLLGQPNKGDITVTSALSDQMARPGAVPLPTPVKGKGTKAAGKPRREAATPAPDASATREAQKAAQAPTASNDSTGIGGPFRPERVVRAGDGPLVAAQGADGAKRQIRLIVP